MDNVRKKNLLSPAKVIAAGFLAVIAAGTILLSLPVSHSGKCEVGFLDALFSTVSAVCVTGLITVDTGAAYSMFGQVVIALLLQIGGLGITSLGAGFVALLGGKLSTRGNSIVREALNYPTYSGIRQMIRSVMVLDFSIEAIGAFLSFFVFVKDYPVKTAVWYSVFHSIAAFNNGGFDVLGRGDSVGMYTHNVWFNIVTCVLIVLGGLGFLVMRELLGMLSAKLHGRELGKLSLHAKVVLMMTGILVFGGALLIKLTEGSNISVMGAFFASITARTAGFATYPLGGFSNAGILVICVLMVIGASPGSTGGGIKTTTAFVFVKRLVSVITGREARVFRRKIKDEAMSQAFIIVSLAVMWILLQTAVMSAFDPGIALRDILFEQASAFSTTGLSTGITSSLSVPSKLILIVTMYVGRLGPLTIATLWSAKKPSPVSRPEGDIPIG